MRHGPMNVKIISNSFWVLKQPHSRYPNEEARDIQKATSK